MRDEEIDKELRFHVDERVAELVAAGVTPDEARSRARLELGGMLQTREAVRDARAWPLVNGLAQDVRLAVASAPRDADRHRRRGPLAGARHRREHGDLFASSTACCCARCRSPTPHAWCSSPTAIRRGVRVVDLSRLGRDPPPAASSSTSAAAWSFTRFNLATGGETQFVDGSGRAASLFDTLGVPALLGRTFSDADDRRGGGADGPVAVISYGFWQRRFGGAADAIGRSLPVERVPFTIVGVTPPDFFGPEVGRTFDVVVPLGDEPLIRGRDTWLDNTGTRFLTVIADSGPGSRSDGATAALRAVQPQIREATLGETLAKPDPSRRALSEEPVHAASGGDRQFRPRRRYERPLLDTHGDRRAACC